MINVILQAEEIYKVSDNHDTFKSYECIRECKKYLRPGHMIWNWPFVSGKVASTKFERMWHLIFDGNAFTRRKPIFGKLLNAPETKNFYQSLRQIALHGISCYG